MVSQKSCALFNSAGIKNNVQRPNTFSKAKNMKIYAVLSRLAKCSNLCIKVLCDCLNWGEPTRAMPVLILLFFKNGFPKLGYCG